MYVQFRSNDKPSFLDKRKTWFITFTELGRRIANREKGVKMID